MIKIGNKSTIFFCITDDFFKISDTQMIKYIFKAF